MIIYTIQDNNGKLYPKAILEIENKGKVVREGKIINIDYGLETVNEYLQSKNGVEAKEYDLIHYWLHKNYGSPRYCENKKCEQLSKTFDWALIKGKKHKRERNNYKRLCRKCHIKYDWNIDKSKRLLQIAHTDEANKNRSISKTGVKRTIAEKKKISDGMNEQSKKKYTFKGKEMTLSSISKLLNISYKTLFSRVNKYKYPIELALLGNKIKDKRLKTVKKLYE